MALVIDENWLFKIDKLTRLQQRERPDAIKSKDFQSSIGFSIASLKLELGDKASAIAYLSQAKISSKRIPDHELKAEIHDLLEKID